MTTIVLSPSTDTTSAGSNATVYSTYANTTGRRSTVSSSAHAVRDIDVESAVFAHIQALRALGITRTDVLQIASGLGLPQSVVERTVSSLTRKGVKVVNG